MGLFNNCVQKESKQIDCFIYNSMRFVFIKKGLYLHPPYYTFPWEFSEIFLRDIVTFYRFKSTSVQNEFHICEQNGQFFSGVSLD